MTPARIFVVDKIPYLPNGKLDRKSINALALDVGGQQAAGKQKTAGFSEKMQVLVGGIEEALNGPIDDFVNYSVINHVMPKLGLGDWWTLSVVTAIAVGIVATVIWNKVVTKVRSLRRMPADASLPV